MAWNKDELRPKMWIMRILSVIVFAMFAIFSIAFWASLFRKKSDK